MKTYLIYILYDPRQGREYPKYVGITSRTLDERLREHIELSNRNFKTYKFNWIRKITSEGIKPEILQIDTAIGKANAEQLERSYITQYLDQGFKLTNCTRRNPESTVNVGKGVRTKRIFVFDRLTGERLYTFESVKECAGSLNLSEGFVSCCAIPDCDKSASSKYIFVFEEDFDPKIIYSLPEFDIVSHSIKRYEGLKEKLVKGAKEKNSKKVASILNGQIVKVYQSMADAAKDVNGKQGNISKVCLGIRKQHKGFGWIFYEDIV